MAMTACLLRAACLYFLRSMFRTAAEKLQNLTFVQNNMAIALRCNNEVKYAAAK